MHATARAVVQGHPNQATRLCPWCGDDTYALGWGILKTQAMVGAKAAPHYGCGETRKYFFANGVLILVCLYVGYCKSEFTQINNA